MEQEKNTLTVLEIAPGQYPKQVEIDSDLKALQQAVGGNIGASYPFSDPVAIVYNDDGKLMGLPQKYEEHFHQPEDFIQLGHRMMIVRVPDEAVSPEDSKTAPPKDAGHDR